MGRLALQAVGTAVGAYFGGPVGASIGYQIGSLAGQYIFPEVTTIEGPRLEDLGGMTSAYGTPIPIVFGVVRIPCNVVWAEDIQEHEQEESVSGGKGGGGDEQVAKTYSYTASFSGALCEGVIDDYRRLWFDSVLICDFSDTASNATRAASETFEFDHITFYQGTDAEAADPIIEAVEGVGNVNRMNDICRLTFDDIPLEDYGNRRPNVTCEIARDVTVLLDWTTSDPGTPPTPPNNRWLLQNLATRYYRAQEPDTANGFFFVQRTAQEALGEFEFDTQYTFRCDVKREDGTTRHGYLHVTTGELNDAILTFSLDDGSELNFTDSGSIVSSRSISAVGDGWFRASMTFDTENQSHPSFHLKLRAGACANNAPVYSRQYNYDADQALGVRNPSFATTLGVPFATFAVCEAIETICTRAGLQASDIDCMDIESVGNGFIVAHQSARSAIEKLAGAYFFDAAETQGVLKFTERGGASVATIDVQDMAVGFEGDEDAPALIVSRAQELEIPRRVSVRYMMRDKLYERGEQHAQRQVTDAVGELTVDLPLVLTDDEAAKIADTLLRGAWTERVSYSFALPMEYYYLDPNDVITITDGGESFFARITSITLDQIALLRVEAVREHPSIYDSNWAGVGGPGYDDTVAAAGDTLALWLDVPMLAESLNEPRITYSADGESSRWFGARLYRSLDAGASYDLVATVQTGRVGETTDALADAPAATWDDVSTVNVSLHNVGRTLESRSDLAVLAGANHAAIGAHGRWEIVGFANATLEGDGTYTLSRLLRGRLGTDHNTGNHAIADGFALLTSAAVGSFEVSAATIGVSRKYKAVSAGADIADVGAVDYTYEGENLKPYSPSHIAGSRDGSNNLTITWVRRSRFTSVDLDDPPLGEDSEAYEVDIMSGAAVLRTITATTETATYTAAQQTTDGLTPGDPVEVNIYQMSAIVGRGNGRNATI